MAAKSRRIPNINGASLGPLKGVPMKDTSKGLISSAAKSAPSLQRALVNDILLAVKLIASDVDEHLLALDAKLSDIILGRIASLLDEVKESFVANELEEVKLSILDEISGISLSGVLKNFLLNLIAEIFDSDAKKEDIEELKDWMLLNIVGKTGGASSGREGTTPDEVVEDEEKEGYKDSTIALNFYTLQTFVQKLFDTLNKNLKNVPGQSGVMSKLSMALSNGLSNVVKKVSSIGKLVAKGTSSVFKGIGSVTKMLGKGVFAAIGGIATGVAALGKGMKNVISGIGSIGSKVGKAIASPFKKVGAAIASPFKAIGGFFSSLNPFKKKDKNTKAEERKLSIRDRIQEKISGIIEKLWNKIEPFIGIVTMFISATLIPIIMMAAKVLLIIAAITLLVIGAIIVYKWVKEKILKFWNYIVSGEMLDDIISGLKKAWEWLVDFGKWLWDIILDALKYIFWDMWIDLGKWIWEKLKLFGRWLYDNYIDKYIILPLTRLILPIANLWVEKILPVVQPFIDSLTNLKDRIVKAFSAWDSNKSIWENLKNIGGIIKDAVVDWWNESPFKVFYENNLKPFIDSVKDLFGRLANLGGFIKQAILDWWNGDSSLGDTLKNIGKTIFNTVKKWWEESPIKKWYDEKLKPKLDAIKEKLSKVYIHIPVWDKDIYPFAPMVGEPFLRNGGETAAEAKARIEKENIDDKLKEIAKLKNDIANDNYWFGDHEAKKQRDREKIAQLEKEMADYKKSNINSSDIAKQQIQQAAKPIQELENMQNADQKALSKDSQEILSVFLKKEEDALQQSNDKDKKLDLILNGMNAFKGETLNALNGMNGKLDDPKVVSTVVSVNSLPTNDASMKDF